MGRYFRAQALAVFFAFVFLLIWLLWEGRDSIATLLAAFPSAAFVTSGVYLFGGFGVLAIAALAVFRGLFFRAFAALLVGAYFTLALPGSWLITEFLTIRPYETFVRSLSSERFFAGALGAICFGAAAAMGFLCGGQSFNKDAVPTVSNGVTR